MLDRILKLLFPPKCIFCTQLVNFDSYLEVCQKCEKEVIKINDGYPLIKKIDGYFFDEIICMFEYKDLVRESLISFKSRNKPQIGLTLSKIIQNSTKTMTSLQDFDIIICVPLHWKKLNKRGYNQSYILSKEISKILKIKEYSKFIKRVKNTKNQKKLTRFQRKINVKNVFELTNLEIFKGKKILIIDDIYTTGATVNECSKMLKKAEVEYITVLVIASGFDFTHI